MLSKWLDTINSMTLIGVSVADPGIDLRGGVDFVKGGRKSSESVVG